MSTETYYRNRHATALEVIDEQADALRQARHLIWALFVLLALVSFALGMTLAQTNFATQ